MPPQPRLPWHVSGGSLCIELDTSDTDADIGMQKNNMKALLRPMTVKIKPI
jgi:hypothetical protein